MRNRDQADVLIVCGQGVYIDGCYYSEYPDRDIYLGHAIAVRNIFNSFNYSHIVCSGGYSQRNRLNKNITPTSEAESFIKMWKDTKSWPLKRGVRPILDNFSLDSAENVILGLICARRELKNLQIRRIGVFSAWQFKKKRFNNLAKNLEIIDRFYFHGYQNTNMADAGELALLKEEEFIKANDDDPFLLSKVAENKKRARYAGQDYDTRLAGIENAFPSIFQALNDMKKHKNEQQKMKFVSLFRKLIIDGSLTRYDSGSRSESD